MKVNFRVKLTRLSDAQITGYTLFLGESMRVFLKRLAFDSID